MIHLEEVSIQESFSRSQPGSSAVLCIKRNSSETEMVAVDWFSWLNMRHQPMLSCAVKKDALSGVKLSADDELILAVVPGAGPETDRNGAQLDDLSMRVPRNATLIFQCTVFGQYNYPFKKVRIINLNLLKSSKVL